jgi:hypothetical protein
MLRSFGGTYCFYLQGDNLVHTDAEMQNMQPMHGAETQRRPASAFVIVNYVPSVSGEDTVLTIFKLQVAMKSCQP